MRLLYLEWDDSASFPDSDWHSLKESKSLTPDLCKSVGWVIAESPDHLTLASHLSESEMCGEIAIPKTCIRKRRILKCPI